MDLLDLLATIKHRILRAAIFGMRDTEATLLTTAIDTCAACSSGGRILSDAEIEAGIEKSKQDLEEYKHQLALSQQGVHPETVIDVRTMDDLTTEQSEALDELVSEAQALGFYDVQEKTPLDANG
jgi:hypothetical protein